MKIYRNLRKVKKSAEIKESMKPYLELEGGGTPFSPLKIYLRVSFHLSRGTCPDIRYSLLVFKTEKSTTHI